MIKTPTQTNQEAPTRRNSRWVMLLIALPILGLALFQAPACAPQGHDALQISGVSECGSDTATNVLVASGVYDISFGTTYSMALQVSNWLAQTSNPAQFKSETNSISVTELQIWFEYPEGFSLAGGGAALYADKSAPYIQRVYFRVEPTTQGDFTGLLANQTQGQQIEASVLQTGIIPRETILLWRNAQELNEAAFPTTGMSFQVLAHITVVGKTLAGSVVRSEEMPFPIRVCNCCLNGRGATAGAPAVVTACNTASSRGTACRETINLGNDFANRCPGQDGVCLGLEATP